MGAGIVRIATDDGFDRDVLADEGLTLVSFGTSWCGPCKLLGPSLRYLAAARKDRLKVLKLDVEASPATADRYGIETFPVTILFAGGEEVLRLDGYMPLRRMEAALQPHLDPA